MIFRVPIVILLPILLLGQPSAADADEEAARRQYRIARRLAAEGSAQAGAALDQVVTLDPDGPLADDARLEQVLLLAIPRSLDDVGRLGPSQLNDARRRLQQIIDTYPHSDRVDEARFLQGLLWLEPLPGFDAAAARLALLGLASDETAGRWRGEARLAIASLEALSGHTQRAADAAQRLLIDESDEALRRRAQWAWAGYRLRDGSFGDAAAALQKLLDEATTDLPSMVMARDLAIRSLLSRTPDVERFDRVVLEGRYRSEHGIALRQGASGDEILVIDRKQGQVLALDRSGRILERWVVDTPLALATTAAGRLFAASGTELVRLDTGGRVVSIGSSGGWDPVTRLAADGLGGLYLVSRRAASIGYLAPGSATPRSFFDLGGVRSPLLAWDGRSLLVLDPRGRLLKRIDGAGRATTLGTVRQSRPQSLTVDGAGRIAVLDGRSREIGLYTADGIAWHTLDLSGTELQRPGKVLASSDGALHLFDDANGVWGRLP